MTSPFVQNGSTAAVAGGAGALHPALTGVTAGNTLICCYAVGGSVTLSAPTDSSGQTWTLLFSHTGTGNTSGIAYLINANSGTHTLTWTGQSDGSVAGISEWTSSVTGTGGTPVFSTTASATSLTSATYTPGSSNEVVIALLNEFGATSNDHVACTTAAFQSIGSLSDNNSNPCIVIEQNGSGGPGVEANANVISTSSTLTCAWSWTTADSAVTAVAGFAYSPPVPPLLPLLGSIVM